MINDAISGLAARMPAAARLAAEWTSRRAEWPSAAGWNVVAILATGGRLAVAQARPLIDRIAKEIGSAKNRARYSMNNALIAIGGSIPALRDLALGAARAIGPVEVDHGATGCKTPSAEAYITRMAHRNSGRTRGTDTRGTDLGPLPVTK